MTVESFRGENESYDKFPIGLRVLAVDDDPTCLKLLETLLRKCQYHVTSVNQARKALAMLREDKDRFDLVISDVHMPDMDGFKLLEHVGLEMDLPVIMLSANGDPKLVMKGVTHGACDYLVKPVRLEELKNIWQHVIRKKKVDPKKQTVQARQGNGEVQETAAKGNSNAEQNGRVSRKRKDDEEDSEDDGNDSDPTTQKKPRVVWSIELHRKFVAAVNQLGIEKAVPKRILDMMNVEGLTRENVASHLQKYRLYLKRISTVANHQVNMAAALGFKDTFMRAGSYDGFGDFRTLAGNGRIGNATLSPYNTATPGMLGRLNSPSNVNLRNISPLIQTSPAHNSNNSFNALGKVLPAVSGQNSNLFQGIPSSLELDQLQSKGGMGISGFDDSRMFTSGNLVGGPATGSSSNLLNNVPNNPMTLSQLGNMSSQNMASFNSEPFNVRPAGSSNMLDPGLLESYKGHSNSLVSTRSFNAQLPLNNARENSSSNAHFMPNLASLPLEDSRGMMSHEGLIGEVNQRWGDGGQTYGHGLNNNVFGSLTSHSPGILSPSNQCSVQNNGFYSQTMPHMSMSVNGRATCGASTLIQQTDGAAKLATEPRARSNENFVLEQPELQGGFVPQGYDLDILMNSVIKREQDGGLPNCNFRFDDYTFGSGL